MKILHVCNEFYPCVGGIQIYVENLCLNLQKYGHQLDVVCYNTCAYSKKKLKKYEEYKGIKIFRIPYLNFKFYKPAPSVLKFIKNYDIIHIHGLGFFSDFLLLTKIIHKKHLIVSGHGGIFHTKKLLPFKKIYFDFWSRFILKFANAVIAESSNNFKIFSKICKPILIPYSIYYENFLVKRKEEKNSFLFVGRISKNKCIDNLIRTFYCLKKFVPSVKLYVVGEDWEGIKKDLDKLVKNLGLKKNVIFVGEKRGEKLLKYYARTKFFISASKYEGFGISVIEAMAVGCIPIVNNIEAFRSFIKNGKNGFIVDYSNPKKVAEAIYKIMETKDLKNIVKNSKKTAKEYDWENQIKKIEKVYNVVK